MKAGITFVGVDVRKERSRMAVLSLAALRRSLAKSTRSKKLGVTHHRRIAKLRTKQKFHFPLRVLNLCVALEKLFAFALLQRSTNLGTFTFSSLNREIYHESLSWISYILRPRE